MSHVTCPKCGSNDHISGYGLACGPMGSYTICNSCDALLEFCPDLEGLDDERATRIQESAKKALAETWGTDNEKQHPQGENQELQKEEIPNSNLDFEKQKAESSS